MSWAGDCFKRAVTVQNTLIAKELCTFIQRWKMSNLCTWKGINSSCVCSVSARTCKTDRVIGAVSLKLQLTDGRELGMLYCFCFPGSMAKSPTSALYQELLSVIFLLLRTWDGCQLGQGNVVFLCCWPVLAHCLRDGKFLDCIPWAPLKEKEGTTPATNYRCRREKPLVLNLCLRPVLKV